MPRIIKSLSYAFLTATVFVTTSQAATRTAASCNASDVQTTLNAAQPGDTIGIPAGICTWTTAISWTAPANVVIQGSGSQTITGGGDSTVIIDNVSHSPNDNPMLTITTGSAGQSLRITGITFKSNGGSSTSYAGSVVIRGNSTMVRIDHSHFALTANGKQAAIQGCVYGVMDHSIVDFTPSTTSNGFFLHQANCNGDALGYGNGQWAQATSLGSANFFYFEDNIFNGGTNTGGSGSTSIPNIDDCSGGGRFVFRFNTINGAGAQGHATGHAGTDRSCRAYEIYQNTFGNATVTNTSNPAYAAFYNTGGTGVIWGNTVTGYYQYVVQGNIDRTNSATYGQTAPPNGWGYCSSTPLGGVPGPSNWDQNVPGQNGSACLDQIGRGSGDLLQGSFPNVCNANSSDCANGIYTGRWPNQALEPVYEWMNKWQAVPGWPGAIWAQQNSQATPNRDYYLYTLSWNGTAFSGTPFNGTAGTGSGPLASRPSTCTKGVAYWATDQGNWNQSGTGAQGTLYQCSATNTWTTYYTPYTYPHPLIVGSGSGSGSAAPTNLHVTVQ